MVERDRNEREEKAVAIYHVVYDHEGYEESAKMLLQMVHEAEELQPGRRRKLFLDIEGHRNRFGELEGEMLDLIEDFVFGFLARYVAEIHCPLGTVVNPRPQDNDLPAEIDVRHDTRRGSR